MDEYTKKIIYYMNNPKFEGKLDDYTIDKEVRSNVCGDFVRMFVKIENNIIKNIGYKFSGCSLNIASLEIFCDYIIGKNVDLVRNLTSDIIKKELNYSEEKKHCVELSVDIFREVFTNN